MQLELIGRGGQGSVCTVRHVAEGAIYIMKRIHVVEQQARRAALREAQHLQLLQHTAVVGYRDCFIHEDFLCIVMEHCAGADLARRISMAREPFTEEQVLQWLVQLALALHHVHERGVLHRDLKAQNVFITSSGLLKLGDFGISKVVDEGFAATCAPPRSLWQVAARDRALATLSRPAPAFPLPRRARREAQRARAHPRQAWARPST